jgi:hypothetical protein
VEREQSLPAFKMGTTITSRHFDGKEHSLQIQYYMFRKINRSERERYFSISLCMASGMRDVSCMHFRTLFSSTIQKGGFSHEAEVVAFFVCFNL